MGCDYYIVNALKVYFKPEIINIDYLNNKVQEYIKKLDTNIFDNINSDSNSNNIKEFINKWNENTEIVENIDSFLKKIDRYKEMNIIQIIDLDSIRCNYKNGKDIKLKNPKFIFNNDNFIKNKYKEKYQGIITNNYNYDLYYSELFDIKLD